MNSTDNRKGKGLTNLATKGVFGTTSILEGIMDAMLEDMMLQGSAVMRTDAMGCEPVSHEDKPYKPH